MEWADKMKKDGFLSIISIMVLSSPLIEHENDSTGDNHKRPQKLQPLLLHSLPNEIHLLCAIPEANYVRKDQEVNVHRRAQGRKIFEPLKRVIFFQ